MSNKATTFGLCQIFEKGSGKKRIRLKGIISTEHRDRQGEIILQDGLDFKPFLDHGWFNDNHSGATHDVLGYPERVYPVTINTPEGPIKATAVEGWLLPTKRAQQLLDVSKSLRDTKAARSLGFSVEGDVVERDADDSSVIRRAIINHVAVTHVPVNPNTTLEAMNKSLTKAGMDTSNMSALMPESLEDEPTINHPIAEAAKLARSSLKGQRNMKQDYLAMFKNMPDDERDEMMRAYQEYSAEKGGMGALDMTEDDLYKKGMSNGDADLEAMQMASDKELGLVKSEMPATEPPAEAEPEQEDDKSDESVSEDNADEVLAKGMNVLQRASEVDLDDSDLASYLEESEGAASVDASGFLKSLVEGQTASLKQISKSLNDVNAQQRATNLTVIALGRLVQKLQGDLVTMNKSLAAPRAPKGAANAPVAQAMAKSFAGESAGNKPLNKAVILAGLQDQLVKNLDNPNLSNQIADAVIRYESTGMISDEMLALAKK